MTIILETGGDKLLDKVVLIGPDFKVSRIIFRDGMTEEKFSNRMSKQWSDSRKEPMQITLLKMMKNIL